MGMQKTSSQRQFESIHLLLLEWMIDRFKGGSRCQFNISPEDRKGNLK